MDRTILAEAGIFACALFAFLMSVWGLVVSHQDHAAIHRLRVNGIKRTTVVSRMIRDICRTGGSGILLIASGWCLLLPPDLDTVAIVLKNALLLVSLTMVLTSLVDLHWRRVIERELSHIEDERG